MRLSKFTKRVLACGMAFALVVTGSNLTAGTASAKKAKTPALSKKKVTVAVGKTTTLKVKNATKKVKWSTSNKKVVKITKTSGKKKANAAIKAVKKGSAVITAKVGAKKLKCKVTVKKKVVSTNIKSVTVDPLDSECMVVTLKKAAAVNVSDLKLQVKYYQAGNYNDQYSVKTLSTSDQTTYRIYLSSGIGNGSFYKLSIGKDTYASQLKRDIVATKSYNKVSNTFLLKKGDTYLDECYGFFNNEIGGVKYSVTAGALPTGLVLDSSKGYIKGIPTAVGSYPVTIQATDELGRKAEYAFTYVVYDETVIACANTVEEYRLDDYVDARLADPASITAGETYYKSYKIAPKGASGKYKFTLAASDNADVRLSTDSKDSATGAVTQNTASSANLYVPYSLTEGAHQYSVTITDANNPAITTTAVVTVNAAKYYNVKGTAKDINGSALSGNKIFFIPVGSTSFSDYTKNYTFSKRNTSSDYDYNDDYSNLGDSKYNLYERNYTASVGTSSTDTTIGKQKGTFSAELTPGEYIVKIFSEADGIYYQMDKTVTVAAADAMSEVIAPVRFYSVMGTATYANGNAVAKQSIYFETIGEQYENNNMKFSVETDDNGAFIASLPANTYAAYCVDEKSQRQYFSTNIKVENADVTLPAFALTVSRYQVTGTAMKNGKAMAERYLYIYNSAGNSTTVKTDTAGGFKVLLSGSAAGEVYTVKYYGDSDSQEVLGTFTVNEQNVSGITVAYNFADVIANATQLTLGSDAVLQSDGNNRLLTKLDVTEDGYYNMNLKYTTADRVRYMVYNSDGEYYRGGSMSYSGGTTEIGYLSKGKTYYIQLIPESRVYSDSDYDYTYKQSVTDVTINVTKGSSYSYDD